MTTEEAINAGLEGVAKFIPDEMMKSIYKAVEDATEKLESTRRNERNESIFVKSDQKSPDPDVYTNLSDMLNVDQKSIAEFASILSGLYMKNKKYYTILRDYEIMPILIPQINRVLMFLVNETLSPDIQNNHTFEMKYVGTGSGAETIQKDLDSIRDEMDLDRTLQEVITNRYKLGREYRCVTDYQKTFEQMSSAIRKKMLNESVSPYDCDCIFDQLESRLKTSITEAAFPLPMTTTTSNTIRQSTETITCSNLNIVVEKSPIVSCLESARAEFDLKKYEQYSIGSMMESVGASLTNGSLNEAATNSDDYLKQFQSVIDTMQRKKLRKANAERLDPSKVCPLKIGKKIIGYFYITDLMDESADPYTSQFGQSLKDRLMKSRNQSTPTTLNADGAEKTIAKILAEKIIKAFDPNIGISRVEDIDLLHDYIINNEIYRGNKKITFYYKDDIFDMSRAGDSLLINAVFFTKLYSMILLNNIMTKVLRGRGRQIHTVQMGVSNAVRKYLNNAIIALNNPETNLGMIHGSFENLLNPLNSASDIIIPTEDGTERFITTDYIEGQNVDMDTEFLKFLLNSIVTTFGLDPATIDATNGQIQFARTLSMESLQIANSIKNEQTDLYPSWRDYCFRIVKIMGNDDTRTAVENGSVKISFYSPKSLIIQNTLEEINNVKNYVESIADILPVFNSDNTDQTERNTFVFMLMKSLINLDWGPIETALKESKIMANEQRIEDLIAQIISGYQENVETRNFGDPTPEESTADEDLIGDDDEDLNDDYIEDTTPSEEEPEEEMGSDEEVEESDEE